MLGLIKYYIKMPVIYLFVLLARRSISYRLLQKDLYSYNKRWKRNYPLEGYCAEIPIVETFFTAGFKMSGL